jgi:hypothetical protein
MTQNQDIVTTNTAMPRWLRLKLDELRLARARRGSCRPPTMSSLVVEALAEFVEREANR